MGTGSEQVLKGFLGLALFRDACDNDPILQKSGRIVSFPTSSPLATSVDGRPSLDPALLAAAAPRPRRAAIRLVHMASVF